MVNEGLKLCIYLHVEKVSCSCKMPKNTRAGQRTSKLQLPEGTGELYISIWCPDHRKQTISQSEFSGRYGVDPALRLSISCHRFQLKTVKVSGKSGFFNKAERKEHLLFHGM